MNQHATRFFSEAASSSTIARIHLRVGCIVAWVLLIAISTVLADDGSDLEKVRAQAAYRLIAENVEQLEIKFADGGETLKRHPRSLLRWSNPVLGSVYGEVFVWTHDGKPHVIGSSFRFYSPIKACSVEFQSLSTRKLVATYKGDIVWTPMTAGVDWKPIPDAGTPSERASLRLLQMRKLGKQFTGIMIDRKDETIERRLNLQTSPLIRYASGDRVVDGAIFGMALGTDPEVALLIEAQRSTSGTQWMYALARQNSTAMHCSHKGELVWSKSRLAPPWENARQRTAGYMLLSFPVPPDPSTDTEGAASAK